MSWLFDLFYNLFSAKAKAEEDQQKSEQELKDESRQQIREELEAAERRRLGVE